MKELSIQEKAERYDKAIEIARYYYNDRAMPIGTNFKIEKMFPELIENKDERIRKALIKSFENHDLRALIIPGFSAKDVIAWLEKQGEHKPSMEGTFVNVDEVREDFMQEVYHVLDADTTNDRANQIIDAFDNLPTIAIQKPADKVEPIFRVGDYIRNKKTGDKVLIVQVDVAEKAYCYVNYDGAAVNHSEFLFVKQDEWELLGYKVAEQKLAEDSVKISESSTEERDMTEYKKGFECGKQRVLKYPEDFGLCKKPADKVEPKFREGDWVVYKNDICQIVKREEGCNKLITVFGIEKELVNERNLSTARLWTIQDAKDGDVLASELSDSIILFKGIEDNNIQFYYDYDFSEIDVPGDRFAVNNSGQHYGSVDSSKDFHPATKEQRDILMKAMADAGYAFDFKKLELKKIVVPIFNIGDTIVEKDLDECGYGTIKDIKDGQYIFTDGFGINIDEQEGWQLKTSTNDEQKPTDKVEPKFKVGYWITNGQLTCKVLSVTSKSYELHLYNDDYCHFETDIQSIDKDYHLWTIQDAKGGDVLSYVTDGGDLWIMIYWSLYEPYEGHVHYHAPLVNDNFCDKGICCVCIDNLKPATKEQRDLLFQKMHEAGYEWDAEKKELKKIDNEEYNGEDYGIDSLYHAQRILEKTLGNVDGY